MFIIKILKVLLVLFTLFPSVASAANYEVSVTRRARNLYKIDGKDIYINTRLCLELALSEDVFLKMNGYQGEIIFLSSGERCDVKSVCGKLYPNPGTYKVTVNMEENDWYSVQGADIFIKTNGCPIFGLYQEAVLAIQGDGYGTLQYGRSKFIVEGIYSRLNL